MSQTKINRQYTITMFASAIAYMLILFISIPWLRANQESPLRFIIAVLPIAPILFGLFGFMRFLRQIDELQRRIHLEAFGFSVAATGLITLTVGFLDNAGVPQFGLVWVFPMMIVLWGVGAFLARRRYQ